MRGTIDQANKCITLVGQSLSTPGSPQPTFSACMCCLPSSTPLPGSLTQIPFDHVLHVERVSGNADAVELSFYVPKIGVRTQVLSLDGENVIEEIERLAYPNASTLLDEDEYRSRALVLINPNSGKGEAPKIFHKYSLPILAAAKYKLTTIQTQYQNHATEIAASIGPDEYDIIICCSGDGTPHEVINGLYQREDNVDMMNKVTVVQIPGGSGNAMTLSCLGTGDPSEATLRVIKGKRSKCDLMAVRQIGSGNSAQENNNIKVSFLSQTYGMIAQADIGTEYLRFLGGFRFDIGVLLEVLKGNKYPCRIGVKWVAKTKEELANHYKNYTPLNPLNDITEKDLSLKYSCESFDELPDGWKWIDDELTTHNAIFYAGKMPYIASEVNFFPAALPNDGCIDIVAFDGRQGLLPKAQALLSLDKGLHVWHDEVDHYKVEAYRILPEMGKPGRFISVDGEEYPFGGFQVEVLKGAMNSILWQDNQYTETGFLHKL